MTSMQQVTAKRPKLRKAIAIGAIATLAVAAEDGDRLGEDPPLAGSTDVANAVLDAVRRAQAPHWAATL